MAGKGDKRRPAAVPESVVETNWDRTFGPRGSSSCPICGVDTPHTHSREEINAYTEHELGISYDELMERSRRVQSGEGIPHQEAMAQLEGE